MRWPVTALLIGCLLSLGGAGAAARAQSQPEITISEFMFAPVSLSVSVGTTVHWRNLDGEPHTIRSVDDVFHSGPLDQSDTYSFKFDRPGTYRYVCSIHPQMRGTIIVR